MPEDQLVQLTPGLAPDIQTRTWPAGTPLPPHMRNDVRVNWYLTEWCNYSCQYCGVLVYHTKSKSGLRQRHAFDHYPVEKWIALFDTVKSPKLSFHITGGEVFLDRENLRALLSGLTAKEKVENISIATNAFWDPKYFSDIGKEKITLDIGFHPTQTGTDEFLKRISEIRDAGFAIAIVNYVLSPENLDDFEAVYRRLTSEGFFVLVSTMYPAGVYISRDARTERELEMLVKHSTPLDLRYKLVRPKVKGVECFFPAMNYYLMWDGRVQVNCTDGYQNVFEDGFPELPRTAIPCPREECIGCLEMYRTIVDEPLNPHPVKMFKHRDMAREVSDYRGEVRAKMTPEQIAAEVSHWRAELDRMREPSAALRRPALPPDAPKVELPGNQKLFGYVDATDGKFYTEARSRDRIWLGGWVATAGHGAPVREVKLRIAGREVASIRDFYPRPDVARHFGRENWLMSGWTAMVYLPALAKGEHGIVVEAIDPEGNAASLPAWPLHIVE